MTDPIGTALSEEFAAFRQAAPNAFTPPPANAVFTTARTRTVRRRVLASAAVVVAVAVAAGITLLPASAIGPPMPPADIVTTAVATATPPPSASGPTGSTGQASGGAITSLPATPGSGRSGQPGQIRQTDWSNASIRGLDFCGESDDIVEFRNGSNGYDIPCVILPGGARPVYAEFLVEEPANRPATEDALVLVELGNQGAARRQALVPVAMGADGRTLIAWPAIEGDQPSPTGDQVMTFTAYRIEQNIVVATVNRLDGTRETRRYRQGGMYGPWEQF
ncbi:hypothetical protein OHA72_46715 [Dactylosporangium sp. NBC_01737]|uniref:hypothetical protein n=1 Tax=Dactylosporangium sp. NBC_01737 TaxID=2975959 RepID=UPI002E115015|nr:hypothetical protein OHA72_46715 [Dactylosporangium sp. NBC_01737]